MAIYGYDMIRYDMIYSGPCKDLGFPKMQGYGGTFLGVPIIRILVY